MAFYKITPTEQKKRGTGFIARVRCKAKNIDKSTFFKTRIEAEEYAHIMMKSLNLNMPLDSSQKRNIIFSNFNHEPQLTKYSTISEFIEQFLQYTDENPRSISDTGRGALKQVLKHNISNIPLFQINYNYLVDFCRERLQHCQPQTVRLDISALSRVIKEMSNKYNIENFENPVSKHYVQLKKTGHIADAKQRTRRLKKGEFRKLYRECYKYQNRSKVSTSYTTFFCLSILSCLRCDELATLKWSDIDFENNLMCVRKGKNTKPGTNGIAENPLLIAMQPEIRVLLKRLKERSYSSGMFIFPIKASSFSSTFPELITKAGLKDLRLHDMRREGISRLLEKGLTPIQVAALTGHRDLTMIESIYNAIDTTKIISQMNLAESNNRYAA